MPLVQRLAAPASPVPVLTYHNIGHAPEGATHRGLYLAPEKFRAHLEQLARHGWRGVSMDEGLPYLRGERRGKVAVITFDDGYVDNLEFALPVLRAHGFGATCYLVADRIGGHNAWDSERLGVEKPLMDLPRVREWLAGGMAIGSHTLGHPHLTRLAPVERRREIAGSRAKLQDLLGQPVPHFCFPYGDHDADCVAAVAEAGYETAVTTVRGRARIGADLLALPRVGNSGKRSPRVFQARLAWWNLAWNR